jgi:hypothetical protein
MRSNRSACRFAPPPAHRLSAVSGWQLVKREDTRWWKVLDPAGELVCLTVFRRGAREVARRLNEAEKSK